jgi:tRNA-2-methylthio-N6-dimethylallyladenosine synthase
MSFPARQPHRRKVHIQTWGCQMNEYDSDKILEVLHRENYEFTPQPEEADLILLNTCSVRDKAEQKVYSFLGGLRELKKIKPHLQVGVGGCVAQQEGKQILKRSDAVDVVFGTDNLFDLPELLAEASSGRRVVRTERVAQRQKVRNFVPGYTFEKAQPGLKAHLAITKGCNNFCSFCIVPITRGLEVSREPEDILNEARQLVQSGTREVCLLGQNVNSYKANGVGFVELLQRLDEIEGLERVRFTSPHPKDFQEELSALFGQLRTLCEQLHLPLQSGSDELLRKMRRWYTVDRYRDKVQLYRERVPEGTLSTDLIVGFPGESEADFEATLEAVREFRFDLIYAFKYSPRPGTPAADYPGHLPEEVKRERLKALLEVQEQISHERNQALIGSTQELLVEGRHPRRPEAWNGRTRGNHAVAVEAQTQIGELLPVRITEARTYALEAEPLV